MADEDLLITQLPLRGSFAADCNFPIHDGFQTWRVTGQQLMTFFADLLMPPGTIIMHGSASGASGFLHLNGGVYLIEEYQRLYNAIGNQFANCRNMTTGENYANPPSGYFRVLDMRGAFARNAGQSFGYPLVELGKAYDDRTGVNGLTKTNIPSTNHEHNIAHVHPMIARYFGEYQAPKTRSYARLTPLGTNLLMQRSSGGFSGGSSQYLKGEEPLSGDNEIFYTSGVVGNKNSGAGTDASSGGPSATMKIDSNDSETAPISVGVHYLMKT